MTSHVILLARARRITPEGGTEVVADDPRKAFLMLWTVNGGTPNSYALTQSWARVFGFAHPKVRSFVQRLEGADRCERFCAWEGEPPAIIPLVRNLLATQIVWPRPGLFVPCVAHRSLALCQPFMLSCCASAWSLCCYGSASCRANFPFGSMCHSVGQHVLCRACHSLLTLLAEDMCIGRPCASVAEFERCRSMRPHKSQRRMSCHR
jgi:hypothetical protein